MDAELHAAPGLVKIEQKFLLEGVLGRPAGRMGAPIDGERRTVDVERVDDEGRARKMAGGADDLGGGPAVLMHELGRVEEILDSVLGLRLFEDGGCRDALRLGELGHDVGFNIAVVSGSAGDDDAWGDAGLILTDGLEDALALLR